MNTNIKDIVAEGSFPSIQKAAIKLINKVNALREIEVIRNEEENKKEEKREVIHAQHVYIKPIFKDTHVRYNAVGKIVGEFTYKKVGSTIWKEVILALDENEADKYLQRMIDKGVTDATLSRAEKMIIIGWNKMRVLMTKLNDSCILPIVGHTTFRKKGYRILRRTYLKPSVRALAKAEVNFF